MTPTRELAEQVASDIGDYAQFLTISVLGLFGGIKVSGQANKLADGCDVLVATPARLLEHLLLNNVDLSQVQYVVLDEADRMLDMGFVTDVNAIIQRCHPQRQTLMFSATTTPALNELCHRVLRNHLDIRVNKVNTTAETVEHVIYAVDEERKIDLFMALLDEFNWFQILVFSSTKQQADALLSRLKQQKIKAALCHGDKSQGARRRALADFKAAKLQVLVATEVAARGLDIEGLDYVLNYHLPFLPEDYVHRIGRTGRAGQSGHAISFVSRAEEKMVKRIESLIGHGIKRIHQKGFEVSERTALCKAIAQKPRKPSVYTGKAKSDGRKGGTVRNKSFQKAPRVKKSGKKSGKKNRR